MALFELSTVDAHAFANDPYVAIPFFQRKTTWQPRQRLGLALSIIRGFPIGTVVVKQTDQQTFLLDGRQRRETLQALSDPQQVYAWAKLELKVESNGRRRRLNPAEWQVRGTALEVFRGYADVFFFGELREGDEDAAPAAPPNAPAEPAPPDEDNDLAPDLRSLFDFMWIGRPVNGPVGPRPQLMSLFDFGDAIETCPYPTDDDLVGLLGWLRSERDAYRRQNAMFPPPAAQIGQWLAQALVASGATVNQDRFDMMIQPGPVIDALSTIDGLDRALHQTSLGYVKIKPEADEADDMKIFSLINTGGTQLTGPEVLCATPAWNEEIENPSDEFRADVDALYAAKGVAPPVDGRINKWDKPATLLDRLNLPLILGPSESWSWAGPQFDSKINLGFRILTGLADGKMMKNDLAKLASSPNVAWADSTQEELLQDSYDAAVDQPFFRYFMDWGVSLRRQMSEYVAVAFLLMTARDYQAKGNGGAPGGASLRVFRKNAIVRFDRLVYESVRGSWGHAGDSRTAQELRRLMLRIEEDAGFVEAAVPLDTWSELIREIIQDGRIDGLSYVTAGKPDSRIVLLLHYANAISGTRPDPLHEPYQVDHIVPQALFRENEDPALGHFEHHMINLAPLNATVNNYKSDRRLNQIDDQHRQEEIVRLTRIPVDRFDDFSSVAGMPQLRDLRGEILRATLVEDRLRLLSDPRQFYDPQQP